MTAKPCWLSHGSPAITALSDEEADGTVEEVEDEEYSTEQKAVRVREWSPGEDQMHKCASCSKALFCQVLHDLRSLALLP